MHGKSEVGLALWREHSSRQETWIVDEERVRVTVPSDGIWRIGNDSVKWLIVPMLWISESIAVSDIKIVVVDVVQKHIDAAEVESSEVDFLSIETLPDVFFAQYFGKFQKQRTRTASWIVNLIYFFLANSGDFSQKLTETSCGV